MSEENPLPYNIADVKVEVDTEGELGSEPLGEEAIEVNFDSDVELLTTVARLLRSGSWISCSLGVRDNFGEMLLDLGESLKGFEKLYRCKEEKNRELMEQVHGWTMRCQVLEEKLEQGQREQEQEMRRMREEHFKKIARIRREFEMKLKGLGLERAAQQKRPEMEPRPAHCLSKTLKNPGGRTSQPEVVFGEKAVQREEQEEILEAGPGPGGPAAVQQKRKQVLDKSLTRVIIKKVTTVLTGRPNSNEPEPHQTSQIDKLLECPQCPRRFKLPSHLRLHSVIHLRQSTFQCKLCGKSFKKPCELVRHNRSHTGERPHSCHMCKKTFTQIGGLKYHIRTHQGDEGKRNQCPFCSMKFIQKSDCLRHQRSQHNADLKSAAANLGGLKEEGQLKTDQTSQATEQPKSRRKSTHKKRLLGEMTEPPLIFELQNN